MHRAGKNWCRSASILPITKNKVYTLKCKTLVSPMPIGILLAVIIFKLHC